MKTAMIWGAGGDIAGQINQQLHEKGWHIIPISRSVGESNTPNLIEANPFTPEDVKQAIIAARQEAYQIDLWVYAAGDIKTDRISELDFDTWQRIINANLSGNLDL